MTTHRRGINEHFQPPVREQSCTLSIAHKMAEKQNQDQCIKEDGISVALTHGLLDARAVMNEVRSPKAGAIVLFAGQYPRLTMQSPLP